MEGSPDPRSGGKTLAMDHLWEEAHRHKNYVEHHVLELWCLKHGTIPYIFTIID
jgi:hypothetical protein